MFRSRANEKDLSSDAAKNKDVNVPLVHTPDGKDFDPKSKSSSHEKYDGSEDGDEQSEKAVQAQERKRRKRRIMKIAVYFMFGIILVGVFAIWLFHKDPVEYIRFGTEFIFTVKLRSLEIRNYDGDSVLFGDIGRQLLASPYDHCWDDLFKNYEKNCLYWRKMAHLRVSEHINSSSASCYTMKWEGLLGGFQAEDCFFLQHYHWYGYLTEDTPSWPILDVHLQYTDFYPSYPKGQADNLVPVWFGAQSVAIFVDPSFPFTVSMNDTDKRQFCIRSVNSPERDGEATTLMEYTICQGTSPKDLFTATQNYRVKKDSELTDGLEPKPLGPLQPMYGLATQDDIPFFLDQMTQNDSDWSLVELFEGCEKEPGDLSINPDLTDQIDALTKAGEMHNFHPAFPVSPFFSFKSQHFQDGIERGYFVMDSLYLATRMILWRGQEGAALDVTNPEATEWYLSLLTKVINDNGIKAIKLLHQDVPLDSSFRDANVTYLEYNRMFYHRLAALNVTLVLEMAAGFITTPVYTPIKMSFKGEDGAACMNVSIPNSLTMGMSGFPLLVAEADTDTMTTDEMFRRWLQLAIFYPVLKIPSIPLSKSKSADLQEFVVDLLSLRNEKFLPYLTEVWKDQPGMPLIRPLWWSAFKDRHVVTIGDQFMVGDRLMVAPVLCEGTLTRSIYLPEGTWTGPAGIDPLQGPQTIQVPTDSFKEIHYFWKQEQ